MNPADIVVGGIVVLIVGLGLYKTIRQAKAGGCAGCSSAKSGSCSSGSCGCGSDFNANSAADGDVKSNTP